MVCGGTLKKIICVGTGIVCGDKDFVRNIEIISTWLGTHMDWDIWVRWTEYDYKFVFFKSLFDY